MNKILTPKERVDLLYKEVLRLRQEAPTDAQIEEMLWDAEFDTLNFPATIAERHGIPFTWKKEVAMEKIGAHEDSIEREEYFDQVINELNEE